MIKRLRAWSGARLEATLPGEIHIASLAFAPAWRRRGMARALLDETVAAVSWEGFALVGLDVDLTNAPAVSTYQPAFPR